MKPIRLKMRKIFKRIIVTLLGIVLVITIGVIVFINQADFGKTPRGERLERLKLSPNYKNDKIQNKTSTSTFTSSESSDESVSDLALEQQVELLPETDIPTIKTDLKKLSRDEDLLVWFGHSSLFIQTEGKRFLVDPVLVIASPVSFINKPFKGTEIYKPEDIPEIDYLVITHDHWDHLDYKTVVELKDRIGKVICGLGVGENFEHWGFDKDRIIELDWHENVNLDNGFVINCLPARHFSGRSLTRDKTLWASYMIQSPTKNIFISGDTGYDSHFAEIAKEFPQIDLVILENGQYNEAWNKIHLTPDKMIQAAKELNGERLMTYHNSKYALSRHSWYEPLINISEANEKDSLNLITPMIGETVYLNDSLQTFNKWWEDFINHEAQEN